MTDPLAKRKKPRVVSAIVLGALFPLLALAVLWPHVGVVTAVLVFVAGALLAFVADSRLQALTPREEMIGREGVVAYPFRQDANGVYLGNVQIGTESWTATAAEADAPGLTAGRRIRVTDIEGLVLRVRPLDRRG